MLSPRETVPKTSIIARNPQLVTIFADLTTCDKFLTTCDKFVIGQPGDNFALHKLSQSRVNDRVVKQEMPGKVHAADHDN